jgi:5-methylcytosine-specific restriction endonuclease McrA
LTRAPAPTPAQQVAFLGNIERLLSEGQFVATYKNALLIAIADLAVQLGRDDGSELELPIREIAGQFIELYWRHSAPYGTGTQGVLVQNSGRQASVISIVGNLQRCHGTLMRAQASRAWAAAITQTARLISTMPLWRLQVLRNQTLDFLYERSAARNSITLKAGVAANLRRFHGMIVRLAQFEWMHFIQALPSNAPLLGATSDLGEFLFGAQRIALNAMTPALADAQNGQCMYCQRKVSVGHIDHFVPWSRYPRDLAHNLVLAHVECNSKKSDLLASESHLERWLERNRDHDAAIIRAGRSANIIVDGPATKSVATWAYSHATQLGADAWVSGNIVEPLTGRWRSLLEAPR